MNSPDPRLVLLRPAVVDRRLRPVVRTMSLVLMALSTLFDCGQPLRPEEAEKDHDRELARARYLETVEAKSREMTLTDNLSPVFTGRLILKDADYRAALREFQSRSLEWDTSRMAEREGKDQSELDRGIAFLLVFQTDRTGTRRLESIDPFWQFRLESADGIDHRPQSVRKLPLDLDLRQPYLPRLDPWQDLYEIVFPRADEEGRSLISEEKPLRLRLVSPLGSAVVEWPAPSPQAKPGPSDGSAP